MKVKRRILLIAFAAMLMMTVICTGCGQTGAGEPEGQSGTGAEEQTSADQETGRDAMEAVPFEAVTELDAQKEDKLVEFLEIFGYYQNATTLHANPDDNNVFYYDCNTAAQCGLINALIGNLGVMGMLNLYPDSGYEQILLRDGELPPGYPFEVDRVSSLSYSKADADAINWIAVNIFNAPASEVQSELELASRASMDELTESRAFMYIYDGCYYRLNSPGGAARVEVVIDDISQSDDHFIVSYTEKYYMSTPEPFDTKQLKADLQYKIINGTGYWSLYERWAE